MSGLIGLLVLFAGAASYVLVPVCVVGYYMNVSKLGVELAKIYPAIWDQIQPRLFTKASRQAKQRERMNIFIREREYLSYGDASLSELGNRVRLFDRGTTLSGIIWFAVFFWALLR